MVEGKQPMPNDPRSGKDDMPYWSATPSAMMARLASGPGGLTSREAVLRLAAGGPNRLPGSGASPAWHLLLRQFRSALVLILIFAAVVSALVGERHEAIIIALIILASCGMGFLQEYRATRAMDALKRSISQRATVIRDGRPVEIRAEEVVPGDILQMAAGTLIAADALILEANEFNVSEAVLTGETFPVQKAPGLAPAEAGLSKRGNVVFSGTSVRSGTANALVVHTGGATEFAAIASAVGREAPETQFGRGIRQFGAMMTEVMLVIVVIVFVVNLVLERPLIDSLLFSLALAVGLAPELLPAIISITLASGARRMAQSGVVVRRLESIENLGSMDTLCTDKTGTLTEGVVRLDQALDPDGKASDTVRRLALVNARLQTGIPNPLDDAIIGSVGEAAGALPEKRGEIPYDFARKRLSVIVREPGTAADLLICKGAVGPLLEICGQVREGESDLPLDPARREVLEARFRDWSGEGYRVLAVATRALDDASPRRHDAEAALCLEGFLLFFDPPKAGISETIAALGKRGVQVKMISGDNRHVAAHVARSIGLRADRVMTGEDLARLTKNALFGAVSHADIFAEIDPNQKERIIEALHRRGHAVGYLGDGINDAPALQAADVGISVETAVDVAREAADIVLLKRDLDVLIQGIDDGRRTFANTMKYIVTTTSANFGNMVSMAFASMVLPFLPLLAKQILLNNLMSDIPSLAIASDNVDAADLARPHRWDIRYVRRFMITFGLVSSVFDIITFGFLLFVAHAGEAMFQTGWFVESLLTELVIVLTIRTMQAFWRSRPGNLLMALTALMAGVALSVPYLPAAAWFGFVPLPTWVLASLVGITLCYVAACEAAKRIIAGRVRRAR
jgi:Mg2+-importing ATPase